MKQRADLKSSTDGSDPMPDPALPSNAPLASSGTGRKRCVPPAQSPPEKPVHREREPPRGFSRIRAGTTVNHNSCLIGTGLPNDGRKQWPQVRIRRGRGTIQSAHLQPLGARPAGGSPSGNCSLMTGNILLQSCVEQRNGGRVHPEEPPLGARRRNAPLIPPQPSVQAERNPHASSPAST